MNFDKIERECIAVAKCSSHKTFNIGAVLVAKGSIVATACNLAGTTGGLENKFSGHAEARLLDSPPAIAAKGAEVYVLRLAKSGKLSMARPCPSCQHWLELREVSRCYYTDELGIWQRLI